MVNGGLDPLTTCTIQYLITEAWPHPPKVNGKLDLFACFCPTSVIPRRPLALFSYLLWALMYFFRESFDTSQLRFNLKAGIEPLRASMFK